MRYDSGKHMKNLSKNLIFAITLLLFVTVIFSFLFEMEGTPPKTMNMSELADKVNTDGVKNIVISGNDLKITLTDDSLALSKKESESGIVETLSNYGVDKEKLRKVNITVEDPSGFKYWMGILIPTLLPIFFMIFLFWFIF